MSEGSASVAHLLAQMRAQREFWVELPGDGGLAVKQRRPNEAEIGTFLRKDSGGADGKETQWSIVVDLPAVQRQAVDWRGFTEAVLLGPSIGSADAVPFNTELWAEMVADNMAWVSACRDALIDQIQAHLKQQAEDQKN